MTIRAHFDGTVIVPDEPVDLPVGRPLAVAVDEMPAGSSPRPLSDAEIRDGLAALDSIRRRAGMRRGQPLPAEALRREHLYGDDGR